MTLWQDQPPQTRRQAREKERSEAPTESAPVSSRRAATEQVTPAGEIPALTTPYAFASARDTVPADNAAEAPETTQSGSVSAFGDSALPPARPNLPRYGASFDSLLAPQQGGDAPAAVVAAPSPYYREAPSVDAVEPVTTPVALVPEAELPVTTPPAGPADSMVPERTLTRRELRAILQAQEANQFAGGRSDADTESPVQTSFVPAPSFAPTEQPGAGDPLSSLFENASADVPDAEQEAVVPNAPEAYTGESAAPSAWPFAPLTPTAGPAADASDTNAPASSFAQAESDDNASQPYQPPVGHWSTATALDDKNQQFDQVLSRSVGASGAATTTNALILPVVPSAPDATGPLTSTGEILVTGSIDLPRGLGSTGQHPNRFDSSDMDRMFEQDENEFNTSDVAPIRASRAVSTHTSTRGVITPPKKRGGRLPVVLSITAAILAIGVVGLLVAGYLLKVF